MSRKQWGHGFNAGYNAGYKAKEEKELEEKRIEEIEHIFKSYEYARFVPVVKYGNRGYCPDEKFGQYLCPAVIGLYGIIKEASGYYPTCISADGNTGCSECHGRLGDNGEVLCTNKLPKPIYWK